MSVIPPTGGYRPVPPRPPAAFHCVDRPTGRRPAPAPLLEIVRLTVNGEVRELELADHALLLDMLREECGLTGAKRSCDVQVCGTCTVLVDDTPVSACCFLARDAAGRRVQTVEGFAGEPLWEELAAAFARHNAFQCGFCAPGFLMTLKPLLQEGRLRSRADVVAELSGNLCRCTGYRAILDAVCEVAKVDLL